MNTNQKQAINTGDIVEAGLNRAREYTLEDQEISFSDEQHAIWQDLFAGIQRPYLLEHLCQAYIDGLAQLQLDPRRIPTVAYLNERIQPRTGWRIQRTA